MKKERIKGIVIGMAFAFALMAAVPVLARTGQEALLVTFNNIRIVANGTQIQTAYEPFIHEGRTYLPVRAVAEALGVDVQWDGSTNTVYIGALPPAVATNEVPPPKPQPTPHSSDRQNRPSNPAISLERAIEIGYEELARQGYTGTFRSNSGMDWERGQWVWELLFRVEGGRLPLVEMYINVDTGDIVKFEWDD